jgi:hypothetical protein
MRDDMSQVDSYLEQQKIDASLIYDVKAFRERYETEAEVQERIAMPDMLYYGKEILEMSIKSFPICRTIDFRQTGLHLSLAVPVGVLA